MKMTKAEVLRQTEQKIEETNRQVRDFQSLSDDVLRYRPRPDQWNVLDCLEHVNLFYADYLPRLAATIQRAAPTDQTTYTPGFFGQKMVSGVQPQEGQRRRKMKTFRRMTPATDHQPAAQIFGAFFGHHTQLKEQLEASLTLDWDRVKVNSAIGPLLRFKLGDGFRLLLAHTERHVRQAEEVLEAQGSVKH